MNFVCSLSWYSSCSPQLHVCVQCQEVWTCVRQCFGQSSTIVGFTCIKTRLAYINSVRLCCHNVQVMFGIHTKAPQNIWKHVRQNIKHWGFLLNIYIRLLMREWKERVWNIFMYTYFSQWKWEEEEIFFPLNGINGITADSVWVGLFIGWEDLGKCSGFSMIIKPITWFIYQWPHEIACNKTSMSTSRYISFLFWHWHFYLPKHFAYFKGELTPLGRNY